MRTARAERTGNEFSLLQKTTGRLKSTATRLFFQELVKDNKKENMKYLHYWPFVRWIYRWLVDSQHKGPVMGEAFPCHDVIMDVWYLQLGHGWCWPDATKMCIRNMLWAARIIEAKNNNKNIHAQPTECRYNTCNLLQTAHSRHPIDMVCLVHF